MGKTQAYGLLFSVELLETSKLSMNGYVEALTMVIFEVG